MKKLFKTIILIMVVCLSATLWASGNKEELNVKNYFQFVIPKYHTSRQSGQTVTIYVRYAYKKDLDQGQYPDYRILRSAVLKYMEPSTELPEHIFWEILATQMGKELMKDYPLEGVSIQLKVLDNQNPNSYEPGDHGPTFTVGEIEPLDAHY